MDHHQNAAPQNAPIVQNTSFASSGVPPSSSSSSMGTTTGVPYLPSVPYGVGSYQPGANEAAMYGPQTGPMYSHQQFAAPPSLLFDIGPMSHHPSPSVGVGQTMGFSSTFTAQHPQKTQNVAQGKKRRRIHSSMTAEPTLKRRASVDGSPLSPQAEEVPFLHFVERVRQSVLGNVCTRGETVQRRTKCFGRRGKGGGVAENEGKENKFWEQYKEEMETDQNTTEEDDGVKADENAATVEAPSRVRRLFFHRADDDCNDVAGCSNRWHTNNSISCCPCTGTNHFTLLSRPVVLQDATRTNAWARLWSSAWRCPTFCAATAVRRVFVKNQHGKRRSSRGDCWATRL